MKLWLLNRDLNPLKLLCRDFKEALSQSLQAKDRLKMKLTDLEARSRRNSIRIHGISEGAEENNIQQFIDNIIKKELQPLAKVELGIRQCHRALSPIPQKRHNPGWWLYIFRSLKPKSWCCILHGGVGRSTMVTGGFISTMTTLQKLWQEERCTCRVGDFFGKRYMVSDTTASQATRFPWQRTGNVRECSGDGGGFKEEGLSAWAWEHCWIWAPAKNTEKHRVKTINTHSHQERIKGPILYCFSSISHRCQRSNYTVLEMHCPKPICGPECLQWIYRYGSPRCCHSTIPVWSIIGPRRRSSWRSTDSAATAGRFRMVSVSESC